MALPFELSIGHGKEMKNTWRFIKAILFSNSYN